MSAPDISAIQASMLGHIQGALGVTAWNIKDGAPRGYAPPQVNVWWAGLRAQEPMEVQEIPYQWRVRIIADRGDDPSRQDIVATAWEAIFNRFAQSDAISLGGNAQLAFPSSVEPIELETEGLLYVGIDITFTVIVKKQRTFTLT